MSTDWEAALRAARERKDEFFGGSPRSPIPAGERAEFDGLDYYPPDPDYRFVVPLEEHETKERLTVETTADGEREYIRWGLFRFELGGEELSLHAYKQQTDDERFWVPFRDETSGETTYPAGRYVDLEAAEDRSDDGDWILDFNEAYSPFCAHSDAYECPLVPLENWLEVRIEAGERYEE